MSLQEFREILGTVLDDVYHWEAWQETAEEYIVWKETGSWSSYASNVRSETIQRIQVELYTRKEYSETLEKLLKALEENEVAFEDPVPDYDRKAEIFRYIVECEVL